MRAQCRFVGGGYLVARFRSVYLGVIVLGERSLTYFISSASEF